MAASRGDMSSRPFATLILGPHRSGTSCVTELVHGMAHDVGRDLLGAHDCNVRGLWENAAVVEFDERLLRCAGTAWFDHGFCDLAELGIDYAAHRDSLVALLAGQFPGGSSGPAGDVVLKDPRMCRAVPLFASAFAALGYRVRSLLVLRDPRECAESLYRRDGIPRSIGFALWISHMLGALRGVQGGEAKVVAYDALTKAEGRAIEDLAAWLDAAGNADEGDRRRLGGLVDPRLRHHECVADASAADASSPLEALANEMFGALNARHDARFGLSRLDDWERRYRAILSEDRWLAHRSVVVRHLRAGAGIDVASLDAGAGAFSAGSLWIGDGGEETLPQSVRDLAAAGRVGLFLNLCERGESASLLRGCGLTAGKDALLVRSAGEPRLKSIQAGIADAGRGARPVLFVSGAEDCSPARAGAADSVLAIHVPAAVLEGFDCWSFVPRGEEAWALFVDYVRQLPAGHVLRGVGGAGPASSVGDGRL